jgi:hypothetical protein
LDRRRDAHIKGELAEMRFDVAATSRGLVVSKPIHNHDYDRIIDCDGRLFRVQIKLASLRTKNAWAANANHGYHRGKGKHRPYTPDEIDIFAVYHPGDDVWFFIPVERVTGFGIWLRLFERYRGAWHLLEEHGQKSESDPAGEGPRDTEPPRTGCALPN